MTVTIAPETKIGEVQLFVADLQRSIQYYQQTLGFTLHQQQEGQAALGAGSRRFLVLNEKPGARPVHHVTGLYHFAVRLPDRRSLARLIYHLAENEIEVQGVADHGVSESIYMTDPDGIGIELYSDRRPSEWPRDDLQRVLMGTEELDLEDLIQELQGGVPEWQGLPDGTIIGHVHLHVANLLDAEHFYHLVLGFDLTQRYGGAALFLSAGGYHHHIGVNTWAGEGAPPPPPDAVGLRWFEIILPDPAAYEEVLQRLQSAEVPYEQRQDGILLRDPSRNAILLRVKP